jgi:hypothetical protein
MPVAWALHERVCGLPHSCTMPMATLKKYLATKWVRINAAALDLPTTFKVIQRWRGVSLSISAVVYNGRLSIMMGRGPGFLQRFCMKSLATSTLPA